MRGERSNWWGNGQRQWIQGITCCWLAVWLVLTVLVAMCVMPVVTVTVLLMFVERTSAILIISSRQRRRSRLIIIWSIHS